MQPSVYIMASKPYGTLYTGVTSDLVKRVWQHKQGVAEGFTKKYKVTRLVWYEQWDLISDAIGREKRIKEWKRDWKINLIERENPEWIDLYRSILG